MFHQKKDRGHCVLKIRMPEVMRMNNKAKTISDELLKLNLKDKMEEMGKTRRNGKKWEETKRNWMILKETGRNRKNRKKGRNRKKQKETGRNRMKQK